MRRRYQKWALEGTGRSWCSRLTLLLDQAHGLERLSCLFALLGGSAKARRRTQAGGQAQARRGRHLLDQRRRLRGFVVTAEEEEEKRKGVTMLRNGLGRPTGES